ncbi:MAG TPA: hypothetical protein VL359_09005, partial [bacterium]|nr:hypothetical protein [bacterium]
MPGQASDSSGAQPFLAREAEVVRQLDAQARSWLGPHYRWYHEVRHAKRGAFHLFSGDNIEEQMLATRSAMGSLTSALNSGLASAHNAVVDAVAKASAVPEGWPGKVEVADRNEPPALGPAQDALIICWQPLKFLTLAKVLREKGKGLPFYSDGLVKRLWFKVVAFYCDPAHWDLERLGLVVSGIPGDASLTEVSQKLAGLKLDVEILAGAMQLFHFGGARLGATKKEAQTSAEELYTFSDEELVTELYLQSLIYRGVEEFLFRYSLTLMGACANARAVRAVSQMFRPLLIRAEETRLQFQLSFRMERDKLRLGPKFQQRYQELEAEAAAQLQAAKPGQVVPCSHRQVELMAYARTPNLGEAQARAWRDLLHQAVLERVDSPCSMAFLVELLTMLVNGTQHTAESKLKMARLLRDFAAEQEKTALAQLAKKRREVDERQRAILRKASKFKTEKQPEAAKAYEEQAAKMAQEAHALLEQQQQAIVKRREGLLHRAEVMEQQSKDEGQANTGRLASAVYAQLARADGEGRLRAALLGGLAQQIQEERDESYHVLYRFLFGVLQDLTPVEKISLRQMVSARMKLEDGDLPISAQEQEQYRQEVMSRKTELVMESPGLLEQRLIQGTV